MPILYFNKHEYKINSYDDFINYARIVTAARFNSPGNVSHENEFSSKVLLELAMLFTSAEQFIELAKVYSDIALILIYPSTEEQKGPERSGLSGTYWTHWAN